MTSSTQEVKNIGKTVDPNEERRRMSGLAKDRETVLVNLVGHKFFKGVPQKQRDDFAVNQDRIAEAQKRGLDAGAYRGTKQADTGYCFFNKEANVRVGELMYWLTENNFRPVNIHGVFKNGNPVTTISFALEGEAIELPEAVIEMLSRRFNHATVWANLRYRDREKPEAGQFRLDTVNLMKGVQTGEEARELVVVGNTYRLQ